MPRHLFTNSFGRNECESTDSAAEEGEGEEMDWKEEKADRANQAKSVLVRVRVFPPARWLQDAICIDAILCRRGALMLDSNEQRASSHSRKPSFFGESDER